MISRYLFILNRICRNNLTCKSKHVMKIYSDYKNNNALPFTIGFSIFTWMGFDKKLSAEDELIDTIKHCVLFIQKLEYEKAEQLLHIALRQAQQIQHQLGITYVYDVMANLALQREQLEKAKQLFVAVTQRIMSDGAKEDDFRVVHISVKLARISHLKKEYSTAQLGYDWCLKKLNKAYSENPCDETKKLLALAEDWYGRLFIDCNQYEHGLNLMITALNRMKEIKDIDSEQIVIQLNDIGTVCDKLGKSDESISYFNEAIKLGKTIPDFTQLGTMYVNIGRVYIKNNLLQEARKNCGLAWRLGVSSKNTDVKNEAEFCIKEINNLAYICVIHLCS